MGFEERWVAPAEAGDLDGIDVMGDHVEAELRHRGRVGRTEVATFDDGNLRVHRGLP